MLAMRLLEEGGESGGIGWMVWVVLLVFLVMVFLGWWVWKNGKLKQEEAPKHEDHAHEEHAHAEPAVQSVAAPAKPDDLTELEGIGPKVAKLLEGVGITTFKQLAEADLAKLRETLDGAGYKYMEPAGWVEQAALAAKGDKEGLAKLQSELKGGRRA
jgi:predicted flap endonuclease-1-like 5' DNA nuclease